MMGIRRTRSELLNHMVLLRATAPMPGWSPLFVTRVGGHRLRSQWCRGALYRITLPGVLGVPGVIPVDLTFIYISQTPYPNGHAIGTEL